jgi:hypothetical protein
MEKDQKGPSSFYSKLEETEAGYTEELQIKTTKGMSIPSIICCPVKRCPSMFITKIQ